MFNYFTKIKHKKRKKGNLADASQKNYKKIQKGNLAPQAFKNIFKDQNRWQASFMDRVC